MKRLPSAYALRSSIVEIALALSRPQVSDRQQLAEAAVGGKVGRVGDDVGRAVAKDEPRADDVAELGEFLFEVAHDREGADNAGKAVAIAETKAIEPESGGRNHQLLWRRGAAQEGEVRGGHELGIRLRCRVPGLAARVGWGIRRFRSCEEPVEIPALGHALGVEAFAEQPEAATAIVLGDVVVAGEGSCRRLRAKERREASTTRRRCARGRRF